MAQVGGVGPFAVQIAKSFGAEVTVVDSAVKLDMLRSIGADHVIDYEKQDFTEKGQQYDLILDVAAHHSIFDYRRALAPNGIYSLVGGSRSSIFQTLFLGTIFSLFGKKKIGIIAWKPNNKEDLEYILELIESGKIKPVIDRCYPLAEVAEAFRYFEKDQPRGKVVITIENDCKTKIC
jgi:NADPH:quinone reductase-like Zn-dependent oxidoreductase